MKKRLFGLSLLLLLLVSGCSAGREYNVKLVEPLNYSKTEVPFTISVDKNGKIAEGLKVSADIDMKDMDHGTIMADFTETDKKGIYTTKVKLPMAGSYEITFYFTEDGEKTEKVMEYEAGTAAQ